MSECVGLVWLSVLSDVAGSLSCCSGTGCDSRRVPAGAPDQHTLPISQLGAWKERRGLRRGGRKASFVVGGTGSGAC